MINQSQCLMYLQQPCHETVQWATGRLTQDGLQVLQTFNFEGASGADPSCDCAYHGANRCDCQVVVLLVYGKGSQPASLLVHGRDGMSWVSLVEDYQSTSPGLESQIRKLLGPSDNRVEYVP